MIVNLRAVWERKGAGIAVTHDCELGWREWDQDD